MKRYLLGFLLLIIAAIGANFHDIKPAIAACPSPLTGRDASGTSQNFGVTVDGSGNCYGNVGLVDGSNAGNKATVTSGNALKVDGSAVTQPVNCLTGCSTSSNQIIAGQTNYPLQVNQVAPLVAPFPLPSLTATQLWDGQHYFSLVPPNGAAQQAQTGIVVRNPDAGNIADSVYGGAGSATENSILKGIYAAATSPLPPGVNTIGAVNQGGNWLFTCVLGCIPSNGTNPLITTQAPTLAPTSLLPSTGLWDGKNYASFAPPNSAPQAWQPALVVTLSPNSPSSGTGANVNVSQFGGTNVVTGTGASGVGIPRFTISNDSNILATQSGTWTVQQGGAPWSQNITQVAGNAVATSASGELKVGIVGNAGSTMDFAGQAATQPANSLLVGAEFNTTPTGLANGQASPLQMDASGNLLVNVKAGGGSGGTSSSFGAAFPGTGTAIGAKNGANMVNLVADNSGNLDVNCAVGCSASSFADQSAFTFGTTAINTIGGVYSSAPVPLASGTAGAALMTAGRILQVNNRDSSGQEVGASLRGQANVPLGVNQVQTALSTPFFPATGLWDGRNYASFAASFGSVIASQPALVTALSPNTPLPAGTNTLGTVTANAGSGTFTVGGTVTANQGTSPWVDNVTQFGGTNISTGTGASGAGIPRVTVANDSNILATQSGTWTVQQGGAPWSQNITQIAGNSVTTATTGMMKVGVAGATGATMDAAGQNAGSPANELLTACQFNTAPTTITSGNVSPVQCNATGSVNVNLAANSFGTLTVAGTVTANQGGAPWTVNPGTAGNWGIGATGSAVPANAVLEGMSQGGNTTALTGTSGNLNVNIAASGATVTVGGTVAATQSGAWNVGQSGTWTVQQGTPPWNVVSYDTGGRQLGASLAGANNVPFVTTQAPTTLAPAPLLPSYGLWDGKNYASFTGPNAAPTALNTALVVTHSPNSTIGSTQSGVWTVQPGNTANTTPWLTTINQGGNSATVNASGQLTVNCAAGCTATSFADASAFTLGTTSFNPIGGFYSASPTQLSSGQAGIALLTQGRILQDNPRNSAGQELGANLRSSYSPPVQVNIASAVTNNTLVQQTDSYGQLRTASMFTDGTQYAALTVPNKAPRPSDSAIVVTPSPVPSLQCPFVQALNASATATVITGQAGKFLHICSYKVIAAAALSFTLNEGTGTTCGTGTTPLDGGGSGSIALAANGGFQTGTGAGQVVIPMQKSGDNLCVQVSTSSVSGYINYGIFN